MFIIQVDFIFSAVISLRYTKNQNKFLNIFGLIFAILGLLGYIGVIVCVLAEMIMNILENRIQKSSESGKKKGYIKEYLSQILDIFEAPRDYSLLYLLFIILQDLLLPSLFVIFEDKEKVQFILLFLIIIKTIIHASISR